MIPTPIPIIREAIQATGLPDAPQILLPLYPDPDKWYNLVSNFTVSWQLPPDVSAVATALNKNPNYTVPGESEGLFDSKQYSAIQEDGVFYLHARFENNQGWGSTAHYRVAIDTHPPLAFNVQVEGGVSSDDPTPKLLFQTGDALSGIEAYLIQINQEEPIIVSSVIEQEDEQPQEEIRTVKVINDGSISFLNVRSDPSTSGNLVAKAPPGGEFTFTETEGNWYKIQLDSTEGWVFGDYVTEVIVQGGAVATFISDYELPPLSPGIYMVSVRAVDKAGNSVEDSIELEILPIDPPVIEFFTGRVLQKLELVNVRGSAIPNAEVIITMLDEDDVLVLENDVPVNSQGVWNFTLERTLRKETYTITAKTRDERGAISFSTEPIEIRVTDKPVIVVGSWEFSLRDLVIIGVILAALVAGYFWRDTLKKALSLRRRSVVAAKDLRNLVDSLKEGVSTLQLEMGRTRMNKVQANNALNKVVKNLNKIDRYVIKDIEEINE